MSEPDRTVELKRAELQIAWCLVVVAACATVAGASEWSSTEVQLLRGNGFQLGATTREIITFEHASGWRLGSNFFFFDISQPFAGDTEIYGEWYPRLSLGKLAGRQPGDGLVRDVSLAGAINAGDGFRAYLAGLTVHLNVPGFAFFDVDFMYYDDRGADGSTFIVTPAWDRPFTLGRVDFRIRGFVDIIGAEGELEAQVLAQPQLLVDVADLWGADGRLWCGIEYQYWRNRYGLEWADESFPQLMIAWQF